MIIEIAGQPLLKPEYSAGVSDLAFLRLVGKARGLIPTKALGDKSFDQFLKIASDFDPLRQGILHSLVDEERLEDIALSVVQNLRSPNPEMMRLAIKFSNDLAGDLPEGERLELVDKTKGKNPLPEGLGRGLYSGSILYRGDVATISGLTGGRLQVGGDVGRIDECETGLVFIKGDLGSLGATKNCGVIVAGRIGSVEGSSADRLAVAVDAPTHPAVTIYKRLARWGIGDNIEKRLGSLKDTLNRKTTKEVEALDGELAQIHRRMQEVKSRQGDLSSRLRAINGLG